MPALVSPSLVVTGLQSPASQARGRSADEPQGRSFHAALDRSRAAQAEAAPADGAVQRPGTPRRAAATEKDETITEIPNLAFFAPAAPAQAAIDASRADADADTAAALRGAATATERTDAKTTLADIETAVDAAATAELPAADTVVDAAKAAIAAAAGDKTAKGETLQTTSATTAKAEEPAVPALRADAAAPKAAAPTDAMLGAALASTVPAAAGARTARADATTPVRDTTVAAATASTDGGKADPLEALARFESAASNESSFGGTQDDGAPVAWMAAPSGSQGVADRTAATDTRVPVLSLAPPVDSDAWAPALSQQMLRMSASGMHTAQLNLNPENLGPLQITLKLGEDQAQATFVSAHEGVRKAVEAALPQLRTSLAEHGISLGQANVGADTRQPAGQGAFAGDNPSSRSNSGSGSGYPGASRGNATASTDALPAAAVRTARAEGAVDTFA